MLPRYDDVQLRTAHDVRFLKVCASCKGLGDRRHMLSNLEAYGLEDGHHHTRCVAQRLGKGVLLLAREQRNHFRLCDLDPELMRRLLDKAADEDEREKESSSG